MILRPSLALAACRCFALWFAHRTVCAICGWWHLPLWFSFGFATLNSNHPFRLKNSANWNSDNNPLIPAQLVLKTFYFVILVEKCTKKECSSNYDCKIGNHCAKGFCKPIKDFCRSDGDCDEDQCCAKTGNGDRGGVCRALRKPGSWCPLQVRICWFTCHGFASNFIPLKWLVRSIKMITILDFTNK